MKTILAILFLVLFASQIPAQENIQKLFTVEQAISKFNSVTGSNVTLDCIKNRFVGFEFDCVIFFIDANEIGIISYDSDDDTMPPFIVVQNDKKQILFNMFNGKMYVLISRLFAEPYNSNSF